MRLSVFIEEPDGRLRNFITSFLVTGVRESDLHTDGDAVLAPSLHTKLVGLLQKVVGGGRFDVNDCQTCEHCNGRDRKDADDVFSGDHFGIGEELNDVGRDVGVEPESAVADKECRKNADSSENKK